MTLNERAIARIREEMDRLDLSQRDVAEFAKWSQSKVAQKLGRRTPTTLDELEALCFAVSLTPTEAVRDHGLEFCAEMAPSELRLLERIRQLPRPVLDAIFTIIGIKLTHPQDVPHARNLARKVARR